MAFFGLFLNNFQIQKKLFFNFDVNFLISKQLYNEVLLGESKLLVLDKTEFDYQ